MASSLVNYHDGGVRFESNGWTSKKLGNVTYWLTKPSCNHSS